MNHNHGTERLLTMRQLFVGQSRDTKRKIFSCCIPPGTAVELERLRGPHNGDACRCILARRRRPNPAVSGHVLYQEHRGVNACAGRWATHAACGRFFRVSELPDRHGTKIRRPWPKVGSGRFGLSGSSWNAAVVDDARDSTPALFLIHLFYFSHHCVHTTQCPRYVWIQVQPGTCECVFATSSSTREPCYPLAARHWPGETSAAPARVGRRVSRCIAPRRRSVGVFGSSLSQGGRTGLGLGGLQRSPKGRKGRFLGQRGHTLLVGISERSAWPPSLRVWWLAGAGRLFHASHGTVPQWPALFNIRLGTIPLPSTPNRGTNNMVRQRCLRAVHSEEPAGIGYQVVHAPGDRPGKRLRSLSTYGGTPSYDRLIRPYQMRCPTVPGPNNHPCRLSSRLLRVDFSDPIRARIRHCFAAGPNRHERNPCPTKNSRRTRAPSQTCRPNKPPSKMEQVKSCAPNLTVNVWALS